MRRASPEVRALAHRAANVAAEASLDGLDAATAVMAAAIHVCFDAQMSHADIADWFRRLATEMEKDADEHSARVRQAMRKGAAP